MNTITEFLKTWLVRSITTDDFDDIDLVTKAAAKGAKALFKHLDGLMTEFDSEALSWDNHGSNALFMTRQLWDFAAQNADWDEIAKALEPCIQVEYDLGYSGGNFSGVGEFAYIPVRLVKRGRVKHTFQSHTGHASIHIIHYESDTRHTRDGVAFMSDFDNEGDKS